MHPLIAPQTITHTNTVSKRAPSQKLYIPSKTTATFSNAAQHLPEKIRKKDKKNRSRKVQYLHAVNAESLKLEPEAGWFNRHFELCSKRIDCQQAVCIKT